MAGSILGNHFLCGRIVSLDLAEIGMELKYIFFQLIGWLKTNFKQVGSLMQLMLVTVLFIWFDPKVTGSLLTKLCPKAQPSSSVTFELGTFPFRAGVLS